MIEFQNVSMAYKDRPVLNHVDLTIQDSEFFVLIGSSGCFYTCPEPGALTVIQHTTDPESEA